MAIEQHLPRSGQKTKLDILLLTRTPRKQRYFSRICTSALQHWRCHVVSYHGLPENHETKIDDADLQLILRESMEELFSARSSALSRCLMPLVEHIRTVQIKKIYRRLYALLNTRNPILIAVWNGEKFQDKILHCVNQHFQIPIAYFENGVLPNSTTLDFSGVNAKNSVPRDPNFYRQRRAIKMKPFKIVARHKEKTTESKTQENSLPSNYILVPFQKDRDSQILQNSPWIKSMGQLFCVMSNALEQQKDPTLHIVFREHPDAKTKYPKLHQLVENHPRMHFNNHTPLQESILKSAAVVTVNSSVGMESVLLSRKVIVLGDAFYNLSGLVMHASNSMSLIDNINDYQNFSFDLKLKNQFVDYLANEYVVKGDWRNSGPVHFQSLGEKIDKFISQRYRPRLQTVNK